MKKFLGAMALVVVLGCGFTSCNDEGCYIVTTKTEVLGQTIETKTYFYGNKEDLNYFIDKAKEASGVKSVTKKKVNKAASDCVGLAN
ncbi:MAG: hypothetical protein Q4D14_03970 [Bacteroidales bacterium]|nr:hypothetical protein [Bacteroidales bacterium]